MKNGTEILRAVYVAIGYYFIGIILSFFLFGIGGGPCNPGIGMIIGMLFYVLALLVGIVFLFINRPFYRMLGLIFCISSLLIFFIFKIALDFTN